MSIRPLQLFSISDLQTSSSRLQIAVGRSPELTLSSVVTKFLQNFLRKLVGPNSPVIFFYKLLFEVLKMLFKTFFVVKIAVCLKKSGIFVPYSRIIFEKLCLKKAFPVFLVVFRIFTFRKLLTKKQSIQYIRLVETPSPLLCRKKRAPYSNCFKPSKIVSSKYAPFLESWDWGSFSVDRA